MHLCDRSTRHCGIFDCGILIDGLVVGFIAGRIVGLIAGQIAGLIVGEIVGLMVLGKSTPQGVQNNATKNWSWVSYIPFYTVKTKK